MRAFAVLLCAGAAAAIAVQGGAGDSGLRVIPENATQLVGAKSATQTPLRVPVPTATHGLPELLAERRQQAINAAQRALLSATTVPVATQGAATAVRDRQRDEECRAATASMCRVCPVADAQAVPRGTGGAAGLKDVCSDYCADPEGAQCQACLLQQAAQCEACTLRNAAPLRAAGCPHIACKETTNTVCPVCLGVFTQHLDDNCRFCAIDNVTEACETCRAAREECELCQDQNVDVLIEGGCEQLACPVAVVGLCPTCAIGSDNDDCTYCGPGNTTAACVECSSDMEACATCMQANSALLPENCGPPAVMVVPVAPDNSGSVEATVQPTPSSQAMRRLGAAVPAGQVVVAHTTNAQLPRIVDGGAVEPNEGAL